MSKTEVKVSDVGPIVIDSARIVYENWSSAGERQYSIEIEELGNFEGITDSDGFLNEKNFPAGTAKITIIEENEIEEREYESNSGPLPVLELRDKKDEGEGPITPTDSREELINHLKEALKALEYLEETENEDIYESMESLENAIKQFKSTNKDWDGQPLEKNTKVDPKTSDALNRALVDVWYDKYESPIELTEGFKLVTVSEKIASEGVEI